MHWSPFFHHQRHHHHHCLLYLLLLFLFHLLLRLLLCPPLVLFITSVSATVCFVFCVLGFGGGYPYHKPNATATTTTSIITTIANTFLSCCHCLSHTPALFSPLPRRSHSLYQPSPPARRSVRLIFSTCTCSTWFVYESSIEERPTQKKRRRKASENVFDNEAIVLLPCVKKYYYYYYYYYYSILIYSNKKRKKA